VGWRALITMLVIYKRTCQSTFSLRKYVMYVLTIYRDPSRTYGEGITVDSHPFFPPSPDRAPVLQAPGHSPLLFVNPKGNRLTLTYEIPGHPRHGNDTTDGTYHMFPLSSKSTTRANDKAYLGSCVQSVFIAQTTEPMRWTRRV